LAERDERIAELTGQLARRSVQKADTLSLPAATRRQPTMPPPTVSPPAMPPPAMPPPAMPPPAAPVPAQVDTGYRWDDSGWRSVRRLSSGAGLSSSGLVTPISTWSVPSAPMSYRLPGTAAGPTDVMVWPSVVGGGMSSD
jgi:hypothetical protein